MKNRSIFTIVIFISSLTSKTVVTLASETNTFPAKGRISGFVVDKNKNQPIPDANIIIHRTRFGTASQDGGYYFIDNIPPGNYDIIVRVIGYRTETKKEIHIGRDTTLNFALIPTPIQMDPIIVTATRSDHLQSKVTVSSEVLTQPRLKELNGNTAGEVIESMSGTYFKNYDGFAGPQTPSIRGSNPGQVLFLLDDQRLNTAQGGGVDLNAFPVEVLERIEIVRGGHSALLGTDAIGGVVHLISKESMPFKGFSYGTNSTLGSFGTQMVTFYGSHRIGTLSYFLNYNRTKSDGDFVYIPPETDEEKTRKNNDYRGDNIFLKTKLDLGAKNQLRFLFQSLKTKRGVIGPIDWPSPEARRNEDRKLFSLQSKNQVTKRLRLEEQIYFHAYDHHYENPGASDDLHKNKALGFDVQAQWNINPHLTFIAGSELRHDKLKIKKFDKLFLEKKRNTQSLFIQTEINHHLTLFDTQTRWKWIPAVRWDNYSDIAARTCPKLGVLISTGEHVALSLRGNIGQSFRLPAFNDLYWPEDDFTKGNPNLSPERSTNYDIGLTLRRAHSSHFQIELTYFQNNIEDLILWEPGDDWKWTPRNVGRAFIKGLENSLTFRLPDNLLYIKIAHTWMKATDESPNSPNQGNRLIYRPDTKIDISTGLNFGPITANLNYRVVGNRYTTPDNLKERELAEYQLLNGNIGSTFLTGRFNVDVKLQALNILDKSIYLLEGYPLPGREFRFTLGFDY